MIHRDRSRGTLASATAPLEFSAIFRVRFPCFPPGGRAVSAERAPDAGSLTPPSVCHAWLLGRAAATSLSSRRRGHDDGAHLDHRRKRSAVPIRDRLRRTELNDSILGRVDTRRFEVQQQYHKRFGLVLDEARCKRPGVEEAPMATPAEG